MNKETRKKIKLLEERSYQYTHDFLIMLCKLDLLHIPNIPAPRYVIIEYMFKWSMQNQYKYCPKITKMREWGISVKL